MMRKFIFGALVVHHACLLAGDTEFTDGRRSLFSYSEAIGLSSQVLTRSDLLVFKDGTLLTGTLEGLPDFRYSFGKVPLNLGRLELLATSEKDAGKWVAKTVGGDRFVASLSPGDFTFQAISSDSQGFILKKPIKVRASDVDFILLRPRGPSVPESNFSLTFANGDQAPVNVLNKEIPVMQGNAKRSIKTDEIRNLEIKGGKIYGKLRGEGGGIPAGTSFASNCSLTVTMEHHNGTLRIPLNNIATLAIAGDAGLAPSTTAVSGREPERKMGDKAEIRIPEVAFIDEKMPMLQGLRDVELEIAEVEFLPVERAYFAEVQDLDIPDIGFEGDAVQVIAANEVPSHDFGRFAEEGGRFAKEDRNSGGSCDSEDGVCRREDRLAMEAAQSFTAGQYLAAGEDFDVPDDDDMPAIPASQGAGTGREDEIQFISEREKGPLPVIRSGDIKRGKEFVAMADSSLEATGKNRPSGEEVKELPKTGDRALQGFAAEGEAEDNSAFEGGDAPKAKEKKSAALKKAQQKQRSRKTYTSKETGKKTGPAINAETPKQEAAAQKPKSEPLNPYEGMAYVKQSKSEGGAGFYIQNKKVTNKEYKKFVDAINYKPPVHWVKGQIPPHLEDLPVVNVTYKDAFLYSVWLGKRLPTERELMIASKEKGVLTDEGDDVDEWTGTPYLGEELPSLDQASKSAKIGVVTSSEHLIFGDGVARPMKNQEFNSKTGFRLAAYGQ